MSGCVTVSGPPASICALNFGTTEPLEASTLPKRTAISRIGRRPPSLRRASSASNARRLLPSRTCYSPCLRMIANSRGRKSGCASPESDASDRRRYIIGRSITLQKRRMLGRIFTVGGYTLLSRLTGFARDIMLAAILGAGPVADDRCEHDVAGKSRQDRKSTRLNSSHVEISYAVFCIKKKKTNE